MLGARAYNPGNDILIFNKVDEIQELHGEELS